MALRFFACISVTIHIGSDTAKQIPTDTQSHLSKLPSDQNTKLFRPLSRVAYIKSPIPAAQSALTAIPASSVLVGFIRPASVPILNTAKLAKSAKQNAEICRLASPEKNIIATTAPSAAPDETPVIDGSASGFLNTLCSAHPESARLAPVIAAAQILGSRNCKIITFSAPPPSPRSAEKIPAGET